MIKPVTTEKAVRMIELNNVITVETERKMRKEQIKKEFQDLFNVKVDTINTLIHNNKKTAYIKLNKNNPAIDVATKLGMM
ncbi:50S ribosomal protein L23 [Candidatus Pacearchaeota archaeon]|nr:50S ribosomal protein L23 [Candidatus Pacearchaeota archaeon]